MCGDNNFELIWGGNPQIPILILIVIDLLLIIVFCYF